MQPKNLLQYAAEYFLALAGSGILSSQQQIVDPAAAAPTTSSAAETTPAASSSPAAAQQQDVSNDNDEAAEWRHSGNLMPDQQPPTGQHTNGDDAAADPALQQEAMSLRAPPHRDAHGTDADTDDAAGIPPSAAWGVSGGGSMVPSLPLVSQLYAARRSSDRQPPPARRSTAEFPAAQLPAGRPATSLTTSSELVQQDEKAAAADVDSVAADSQSPVGPDLAGNHAPEGDAVPAVDEEDAALVALAEREATSK